MLQSRPFSASSNANACNRRSAPRHRLRQSVIGELRRQGSSNEPDLAVSFLDISEGGACGVVTDPLQPGDLVEIAFVFGALVLKATAAVRWSQRLNKECFCVGVRFAKRLSYKEVAPLFQP